MDTERVRASTRCAVCGWEYEAWYTRLQLREVDAGKWVCGPCGRGVMRVFRVGIPGGSKVSMAERPVPRRGLKQLAMFGGA